MTPRETFLAGMPYLVQRGWDVWGPITQAYHETAGFKHIIGSHNYWGIKPPKKVKYYGKILTVTTHEEIKGKSVELKAEFCDWDNVEEALSYYHALMERVYPDAFMHRHRPDMFFKFLKKWATDSKYVDKLKMVFIKLVNNPAFCQQVKVCLKP